MLFAIYEQNFFLTNRHFMSLTLTNFKIIRVVIKSTHTHTHTHILLYFSLLITYLKMADKGRNV